MRPLPLTRWLPRRYARLAGGLCLLSGLFLAAACNHPPRETEMAEVSGTVNFKSKPLPGGRVSFVAVKGGFASSGDIDENGLYKIDAPVGDVKISVDNREFEKQKGPKPKKPQILKQPGQTGEPTVHKGKFVPIPKKYYEADTSGLTYTVQKGAQKYDINLAE